ncbi:MAG: hypothetical protein FJX72_17910 [Armatimonadetes bacterium]|nr:hypothetical protein [Armatimonadota bacterium]
MRALIAALLVVFAFAPAASAQEPQEPEMPEIWSVAGKEVLRIRVTVGSLTPRQRVELLDTRLTEILSKAERAIGVADIELHLHARSATITVCGDLLVTVVQDDADANKTTPERLGRVWLTNIRKTVPLLSPRVNRGGA